MEIPTNYVLFLKGVFPEDCQKVEDQYIDTINESSNLNDQKNNTNDMKKKIVYDKIQKNFTNIKSWVEHTKNTKIKCWYCESIFIGVPIFIPSNISETTEGKVYDVYGVFCSFGCAYAFIRSSAEFIEDRTVWDKTEMLKMLYRLFYNKKIDTIVPSPNKYKLEQYGGDMTVSEYKKELKRINNLNISTTI